jgi:hypothetical protein
MTLPSIDSHERVQWIECSITKVFISKLLPFCRKDLLDLFILHCTRSPIVSPWLLHDISNGAKGKEQSDTTGKSSVVEPHGYHLSYLRSCNTEKHNNPLLLHVLLIQCVPPRDAFTSVIFYEQKGSVLGGEI